MDVPDEFAVIANRTVRGELAHARGVEDRSARPGVRVAPERTHSLLNVDVALVIGEEEEGIVIKEILA